MEESTSKPLSESAVVTSAFSRILSRVSPQTVMEEDCIGDDDGLDFQIVLDSLDSGNTEPLKQHFARQLGVDPRELRIMSRPWNSEELEGAPELKSVRFIGPVDTIPGRVDNIQNALETALTPPQPLPLLLDLPTEIYTYHHLHVGRKQIRLLRLGPRDQLGMELQTFDLSTAPEFYALSYVWGQPNKIMPLPCNGKKIMITQNLFRAIHKTFERYPETWLWPVLE